MKQIRLVVAAILLLAVSLSSLAKTTESDAVQFKAAVKECLTKDGYAPKIDEDGDLQFKYQNENYYMVVSAFAQGYYISLWSFVDIDGLDEGKVFVALNKTVQSLKFFRSYIESHYAIMNVDLYVETLSEFKNIYPTALDAIQKAGSRFIDYLIELESE